MVSNASKAFVNKFVPFTVNFVRVRVINSAYRGPPSDVLSFKTPEGSKSSVKVTFSFYSHLFILYFYF